VETGAGRERRSAGALSRQFAIGTAAFLLRAIGPLLSANAIEGFFAPSAVQAVSLMANYTVILVSSVSFLLMQKERADHLAQQLASLDPLTGAFNRRTFIDLAEKQLSRARRLDSPLSLVLLDVDHFKMVNDTHGHLVGDRVLQRFAEVVRNQLRKEDVFVRYGGEEFCLLLPDVPGPGAVVLAGRIRKAVAKEAFVVDGAVIPLTTSAGVAARIDEARRISTRSSPAPTRRSTSPRAGAAIAWRPCRWGDRGPHERALPRLLRRPDVLVVLRVRAAARGAASRAARTFASMSSWEGSGPTTPRRPHPPFAR